MNQVRKNIVYQIIYRVITILTPLVTSPILSRALGAEKLGIFSATLALVSYFKLISMLGIENYGNRTIASAQGDAKKQQTLFWNIYSVQLLSGFLAIVLYAAAFLFIPKERMLISALQGLWLLGSLFNISWFFFGTEQFRLTITRNIIIKLLTVLLITVFIRKQEDLGLYVVIMAGDAVLSSLAVWPFLRKNIGFEMPRWADMKKHLKPIMILFVPILAMSVFHIMDKTMLDWLGTEADVGYYYSADKVINIPLSIITAIGTVMLPRIANEYGKGNMNDVQVMLRRSTELTAFMICAIGGGIAAIANEFVPWFFGPGFDQCIELVYWFTPVLAVKAISDLIRTQYMIPAHMDKDYTAAVFIGAGINLIANLFLIRRFGAIGAVIGTMIAEFAVMISEMWLTRESISFGKYALEFSFYLIPMAVLICVVRGVASVLQVRTSVKLLIMILAGGLAYILVCAIVWAIKKESVFRTISIRNLLERNKKTDE
ncbi:MAG: oligosaccharide flippase family protein [Clostridia bacterium]|nr:oligosaccharide flippase family protein [Clostridia bacterium]